MSDDTNPVSDRASQTASPESPVEADLHEERSADKVLEETAGPNSSVAPYMGSRDRTEPERAPESLDEVRAGAAESENILPAKPPAPESDAGADLVPRATRGGEPEPAEPAGQRIGNRSRP